MKDYELNNVSLELTQRRIRVKINPTYYADKMVEKLERMDDFNKILKFIDSFDTNNPVFEKIKERKWGLLNLDGLNYEEINELNNLLRVAGLGNISMEEVNNLSILSTFSGEIKSKELELLMLYMFFVND